MQARVLAEGGHLGLLGSVTRKASRGCGQALRCTRVAERNGKAAEL